MQPSRIVAVLSLLMLAAVVGATGWRFLRADAVEPIASAPASPAPEPAPASALVPAAAPSTWGVVAVVPCHGRQLLASGDIIYGCRDRIDGMTGRFVQQGDHPLDWMSLVAVHGDLVVHHHGSAWHVTRASTGEEVPLDFRGLDPAPIGQHGDVVWWRVQSDDGGSEALLSFNLASMSRVDPDFRCGYGDLVFDANNEPVCIEACESGTGTCLRRAEGTPLHLSDLDREADEIGAVGPGRLWTLKYGTLRWINFDGHDDPTFEPRVGVEHFSVLDATEDRVLASLKLRDERDASLLLISRDPHTNQWRASAPIREPIFSWGPSVISNEAQILDSGRVAMLVGKDLYVLAEGGHLETPSPPAVSPLDGMVAMSMDDDGVWRSGETELAPPPTTAAVFVRPASGSQRERFVTVEFLHNSLFANLPASELSVGVRNAVLPNGFSNRVRSWRENGARRWRMQTSQNDCVYDDSAYDVLERGDYFEVRRTHFGEECMGLEGAAAETCRNGDVVFGPVPADAETVPGLPDSFMGDASLEP